MEPWRGNSSEFARLEQLFEMAVQLDSVQDVERLIERECGDRPDLAARLRSLYQSHTRSDGPISPSGLGRSHADHAPGSDTLDHIEPELPPDDRYALKEEIGRGALGVVHRATDRSIGRDVAIKFLYRKFASRQAVVQRFSTEAQISGQLQHPGILPLYELRQDPGQPPFIAMQLVEGTTFAEYLSKLDPSDRGNQQSLTTFARICEVIAYAHSRGVIHRDLKPANVMLGRFGRVLVADWGVAKAISGEHVVVGEHGDEGVDSVPSSGSHPDSDSGSGAVTQTGSVMGTLAYMSPEQCRGDVDLVDERCDVFGLGAILCEILTGGPPYLRELGSTREQAKLGKLEPARRRLKSCGADPVLVALCLECLEVDLERRLRSGIVVSKRLADYLRDVDARASRARERAVRSRMLARATAVTSALLVCIGIAWAVVSQGERDKLQQQLERSNQVMGFLAGLLETATPENARTSDILLLRRFIDKTAKDLEAGTIQDPLVAAEIHAIVGSVYFSLGQPEGHEHLKLASSEFTRLTGEDSPEAVAAKTQFGRSLLLRSEPAEAESVLRSALDAGRASLGESHPYVIEARFYLATALIPLGRYEEAAEAAHELLALVQERDSSTGIRIWQVYRLLGRAAFSTQKSTAEAVRWLELGIEALTQAEGPDHPLQVSLLSELSLYKTQSEDPGETISIALRALEASDHILGVSHPNRDAVVSSLAVGFLATGRYSEALDFLEDQVVRLRARGGPLTLEGGRILQTLLMVHFDRGEYEQALAYSTELYEGLGNIKREPVAMPLHLSSVGLTAASLVHLNRIEEARPWATELKQVTDELLPAIEEVALQRPDVAMFILMMSVIPRSASALTELYDPEEALELALEAVALGKANSEPLLWRALFTLAQIKALTGDKNGARETYSLSLEATPPGFDERTLDQQARLMERALLKGKR